MDKYIGRLLDNRYEILEVIGSGGMAVVYKARCHRLNRLVAIKILKDDYLQDEDFRRRFHDESHAVAMLSHPNIVQVYDVFESEEADYIVMELIDGISLKQYMEKKGVLNWKETLHFAIQIAKALEHAHSRGIVHRDIKPHNVMVLKNGSVKVTDFGIARMMSKGNTLTKEALGSVHYISPEQAKGGRVDSRSDIYSLGVVMYEMMSGRPPYDGETPVSVAIQHINGGAVMPSTLNPNIPGGLEQIIMKAMSLAAAERFPSASAMLHDLDEFRKDPAILFDYNPANADDVINVSKMPPVLVTEKKEVTTAEQVEQKEQQEPAPAPLPLKPQTPAASDKPQRPAGDKPQRPASNKPQRPASNNPKRRPPAKRRGNAAMIALVSCLTAILIALVAVVLVVLPDSCAGSNPGDEQVTVPDLVGKVYEDLPEYPYFEIALLKEEYDATVPAGKIISQDPLPGERVSKNTKIYLVVSKGPQEGGAPQMITVVGQTLDDAKKMLNSMDLNLQYDPKYEFHDTVPENSIIRTEPVAGTELIPGQKITLYVSMGKNNIELEMPNEVGKLKEDAIAHLDAQKLDLKYEYLYEDSDLKYNTVLRTDPAHKSKLTPGQKVKVYLSKGPEPIMPDISTMDEKAIREFVDKLEKKPEIEIVQEHNATVPKDTLFHSEPEAGADLSKVTKIYLYVSLGPEEKPVPNVVGKDIEFAKYLLEQAGFTNVEIQPVNSDASENTVVAQTPEAEAAASTDAKIVLSVSMGPAKVTDRIIIDNLPTDVTESYVITITNNRDSNDVYEVTVDPLSLTPGENWIEVEVYGYTGVAQFYTVKLSCEAEARPDQVIAYFSEM